MASETSHTPLEGKKIRFGVGVPLSGRGAGLGREMAQAIQIAVDKTNASGGIQGARVDSSTIDDKGEENVGLKVAQSFARDRELLAVIGHYNSNVTLCTAPVYQEAGLPMIAPIVSNPRLTDCGWTEIFRFTHRDDATAAAIADYLIEHLGKRRVVVVETRTTHGSSMSEQFAGAFKRKGGEVLEHHRVEEGEEEFSTLVSLCT